MKSAILSLFFALIAINVFATVINVSNAPSSPANVPYTYNSLQAAVDACADGDSLYVHGTNIDYGTLTITNKTVTLIGAGYGNNLQSNFQQKTYISNIEFAGFAGVKNVVLIGLYIPGTIYNNNSSGPVNNLLVERCAMSYMAGQCNNLILRQSLFEVDCSSTALIQTNVISNAIIQNCVFAGNIGFQGMNNSIWDHNIFKRGRCNVGTVSYYNGVATFTNNIFNYNYTIGVSNCTFNNNLFYSITSLGNGNNGTGNIFNTDPLFVDNSYADYYYASIGLANFCTVVNYHLATGSPAIGAGVNSTDMGIFGGTAALPATGALNGVPAMPRITEMNLQNISVAPNGNLNVQIKAVKEN